MMKKNGAAGAGSSRVGTSEQVVVVNRKGKESWVWWTGGEMVKTGADSAEGVKAGTETGRTLETDAGSMRQSSHNGKSLLSI